VPKAPSPKDIRDAYSEYLSEWGEARDERKVDMRYVSGDPWDPADRAQREDAGRPCISLDEINQYINQYNNNLRQNKRAIQLLPKGNGANDKDATRRESIIRGIENRCNAPSDAYITAAEAAAQGGYGFALIRTEYQDGKSFNQSINIERVADPDTILLNPGYEKADASDVKDGFVLKRISRKDFARKFGKKAEKVSFTSEDQRGNKKAWIGDKDLQIAEYWKIHETPRTLLLVKGPAGETIVWEDELEKLGIGMIKRNAKGEIKKGSVEVLREREVMTPEVYQYLTNGLEILEETPWAGSRIPIISCFGKELWFDDGGGAKRHLLSMVRLARNPQMLYAYLCTQECEEAGMTPKAAFIGYKGQFESARETWELINKQPTAFVEADQIMDGAQGQVLPLPSRPQWSPNFQAYEIAKDSARRAIQAAMGITPLPTAAQRNNEKSGVALEKIDEQESVGSFHFQDNFTNGFLHNMGWQLNELITDIMDVEQDVPIEKADGMHGTLHVIGVTSHPIDNETGEHEPPDELPVEAKDEYLHTGVGEFDVTISTGPSRQSQRDYQNQFVENLVNNIATLPIPPAVAPKFLAKLIRMTPDVGSVGQDLADLLDPPDQNNLPPAAQAIVAQLQGQVQQLMQENQALHMDRAAKVLEQQTKIQVEGMKGQHTIDAQSLQALVKLAVAELAAKSRSTDQIAEQDAEAIQDALGFQHDATMQHSAQAHEVAHGAVEHQRAMELSQQQAATAAAQQASQQQHDQEMAQQPVPQPEPQPGAGD
jgi:hypothetical protein